MYSLEISTAARNDLANAPLWYNNQQSGLGNEFLQEVFEIFDTIAENSFLFTVRFPESFVLVN